MLKYNYEQLDTMALAKGIEDGGSYDLSEWLDKHYPGGINIPEFMETYPTRKSLEVKFAEPGNKDDIDYVAYAIKTIVEIFTIIPGDLVTNINYIKKLEPTRWNWVEYIEREPYCQTPEFLTYFLTLAGNPDGCGFVLMYVPETRIPSMIRDYYTRKPGGNYFTNAALKGGSVDPVETARIMDELFEESRVDEE